LQKFAKTLQTCKSLQLAAPLSKYSKTICKCVGRTLRFHQSIDNPYFCYTFFLYCCHGKINKRSDILNDAGIHNFTAWQLYYKILYHLGLTTQLTVSLCQMSQKYSMHQAGCRLCLVVQKMRSGCRLRGSCTCEPVKYL